MERAHRWVPFGVAGAVFAFYAIVAPPSVYWLDSGELTAAGANLAIAHPTGFPLYAALAHWASLFPVGEIAYRVSLLSAACGAVAMLFVARTLVLVERSLASLTGAVAGGLVLAVAWVFFRQATIAEVYAPTAALLAITLFLLVRVGSGADGRWGVGLSIVVGLGLGVHGSYRLLVLLPFATVLIVRLRRGARWPLVVPAVTALTFAAIHAYLPMRSLSAPPGLDWGHPQTATALIEHVRASSIFRSFEAEMFATEAERWTVAAGQLLATVFDSVGPVALLLAAVGLAFLMIGARPGRWLGGVLLSWIAIDSAYSIWINPMGLVDLQNGTPLVLALAAAAGAGVIALSRLAGSLGPVVAVAVAAIAVMPPAVVSLSVVPVAARGDGASRWAEAALDQAPGGATLWVTGDSTAAPLLYATTVMGARPDVVVLVRQLLPDRRRTAALWRSAHPGQSPPARVVDMVAAAPSLWEPGGDDVPAGARLAAGMPLFRLGTTDAVEQRAAIVAAARSIAQHFDASDGSDMVARRVQAQALTQLALHALRTVGGGDALDLADGILQAALSAEPSNAQAWMNRGAVASRKGRLDAAVRMTERAASISPNYVAARVNLARYYLAQGNDRSALKNARRATVLAPDKAAAWALASAAARRLGDAELASQLAARARALDADDRDVRALPAP